MVADNGTLEVVTQPEDFENVLKALEEAHFENTFSEITMIAENSVTMDNVKAQKVLNLIENLEDSDDVQNVASNLDIPQDLVDSA